MTQVDFRHREMRDMIPRFYDDAPEADGILYADAVEIERVRADARDLLTQMSATTATWGLSDWERVLELPPRPNSPAELRRARIIAKLRGTAPATLSQMYSIMNAHTRSHKNEIIELPTPGAVFYTADASAYYDYAALMQDLRDYTPAHLAINFGTKSYINERIKTVTLSGVSITVYPIEPTYVPIPSMHVTNVSKMIHGAHTTIYPQELTKLPANQTQFKYGFAQSLAQITVIYPKGVE